MPGKVSGKQVYHKTGNIPADPVIYRRLHCFPVHSCRQFADSCRKTVVVKMSKLTAGFCRYPVFQLADKRIDNPEPGKRNAFRISRRGHAVDIVEAGIDILASAYGKRERSTGICGLQYTGHARIMHCMYCHIHNTFIIGILKK